MYNKTLIYIYINVVGIANLSMMELSFIILYVLLLFSRCVLVNILLLIHQGIWDTAKFIQLRHGDMIIMSLSFVSFFLR